MNATTDKTLYVKRRHLLKQAVALGLLPSAALSAKEAESETTGMEVSSKSHVLHYNNYYEFSTNKEAVAHLAKNFNVQPWQLEIVDGDQNKKQFSLKDIKSFTQHNRTYRLRCVEGWSAVIPWTGIQLRDLILSIDSKPKAKYLKFESVFRPTEMVGQRRENFPWPYTEGLRMDEALHPLTLLAFGMYDEELAPQCGAPIRLVVPWKYGFKSLKALTKITFTDDQPAGSWSQISPGEYGFYANVNPNVPHPRWSQRKELPLGQIRKIPTLPFNGYEKEVASLYGDLDLRLYF